MKKIIVLLFLCAGGNSCFAACPSGYKSLVVTDSSYSIATTGSCPAGYKIYSGTDVFINSGENTGSTSGVGDWKITCSGTP